MVKCVIKSCKSDSDAIIWNSTRVSKDGIHFFNSVPKDTTVRMKWIDAIEELGGDWLSCYANYGAITICSLHFKPEDLVDIGMKQVILADDAVPIFPEREFPEYEILTVPKDEIPFFPEDDSENNVENDRLSSDIEISDDDDIESSSDDNDSDDEFEENYGGFDDDDDVGFDNNDGFNVKLRDNGEDEITDEEQFTDKEVIIEMEAKIQKLEKELKESKTMMKRLKRKRKNVSLWDIVQILRRKQFINNDIKDRLENILGGPDFKY